MRKLSAAIMAGGLAMGAGAARAETAPAAQVEKAEGRGWKQKIAALFEVGDDGKKHLQEGADQKIEQMLAEMGPKNAISVIFFEPDLLSQSFAAREAFAQAFTWLANHEGDKDPGEDAYLRFKADTIVVRDYYAMSAIMAALRDGSVEGQKMADPESDMAALRFVQAFQKGGAGGAVNLLQWLKMSATMRETIKRFPSARADVQVAMSMLLSDPSFAYNEADGGRVALTKDVYSVTMKL